MTSAAVPEESAPENQPPNATDLSGPLDTLHPTLQNASDNDASEGPVREQLKKTSINNISQRATKAQEGASGSDDDNAANRIHPQRGSSPSIELGTAEADSARGRPVKKRSFDDLEAADSEQNTTTANGTIYERPNGHARKRSRDVRTNESLKGDRQLQTAGTTLQEETEDLSSNPEFPGPCADGNERPDPTVATSPDITNKMEVESAIEKDDAREKAEETPQKVGSDPPDREMIDPTSDPRKKRSRDHFDTEAHREQKIPATEEAKAQRRSDELERTNTNAGIDETITAPEKSTSSEQVSHHGVADPDGAERGNHPNPSDSTSTMHPPPSNLRSSSPMKMSFDAKPEQPSMSFASSGFAAHSNSTASPFGTLGASSTSANTPSPFARSNPSGVGKNDASHASEPKNTDSSVNGGFGTYISASSAGFRAAEPSPFAMSGAPKSNVFGGSVFGGGFGGGFGGSGKLSNFAAPVGDTKLGAANGAIKPIGSPIREGDDKDDDSDEGEGEGLVGNDDDGADEVDDRFQYQNGKPLCPGPST